MTGFFSKLRWPGQKWPGRSAVKDTHAPAVVLYTRQRCHLCDEAKALLQRLQREEPFQFAEIDIDTDEQLRAQFNHDVPVVFIHGRKAFKHRIEAGKFLKSLRAGPGSE